MLKNKLDLPALRERQKIREREEGIQKKDNERGEAESRKAES